MLPFVIDLAIVLLLLAALGLGALLHRRLSAMRADAAGLERLIDGLTAATGRAEHALGELRRTAGETGERMSHDLARAQRLADELRLLGDRADRLADGLVQGISAAREVHKGATGARPVAAPPNGAPAGSTGLARPVPAKDLERALSTLR